MKFNKILSLILVAALMLSTVCISFASDYSGHWSESSVDLLLSKNIISGDGNGNINPEAFITRAEFVKIINRTMNYTEKASENFKDVKEGKWYYNEFLIAAEYGYIKGDGNGYAKPESNITRTEAATIIGRTLGITSDAKLTFKDESSIPEWAYSYVSGLVGKNIISGYPDGSFGVNGSLKRAECFSITAKVISVKDESKTSGNVAYDKSTTVAPNQSSAAAGGGSSGGGGGGGGVSDNSNSVLVAPFITSYDKDNKTVYFRIVNYAVSYTVMLKHTDSSFEEITYTPGMAGWSVSGSVCSINLSDKFTNLLNNAQNRNVDIEVLVRANHSNPAFNSAYAPAGVQQFVLPALSTPKVEIKKTITDSSKSVEITWNEVDKASGYEVRVYSDDTEITSSLVIDEAERKIVISDASALWDKFIKASVVALSSDPGYKRSDAGEKEIILTEYEADYLINAELMEMLEDSKLNGHITVTDDSYASMGKVVNFMRNNASYDTEANPPDLKVGVGVYEKGQYDVWVRCKAPSANSDSLYIGVNDEPSENVGLTITSGNNFAWKKIKTFTLNRGYNTIKIYSREYYVVFDAMYVTANPDFNPDNLSLVPGEGVFVPADSEGTADVSEDEIIDAEGYISSENQDVYCEAEDDNAYGDKYVSVLSDNTDKKLIIPVEITSKGKYFIWLRLASEVTGEYLVKADINSGKVFADDFEFEVTEENKWKWYRIDESKLLNTGVYNVSLVIPDSAVSIDAIYLTSDESYDANEAERPSLEKPNVEIGKMVSGTLKQITISWDGVEGAVDYDIKIYADGEDVTEFFIVDKGGYNAYNPEGGNVWNSTLTAEVIAISDDTEIRNSLPGVAEIILADFTTEYLINAELIVTDNSLDAGLVSVISDADASLGEGVKIDRDNMTEPDSSRAPDFVANFAVENAGEYYVWLRYRTPTFAGSGDSIYRRFNNGQFPSSNLGYAPEYTWQKILSGLLEKGCNTVELYGRESNCVVDGIYITANPDLDPEKIYLNPEEGYDNIVYLEPVENLEATVSGMEIIEAEDFINAENESVYSAGENSEAYSGKYLYSLNGSSAPVEIPVNVSAAGRYNIWVRATSSTVGSYTVNADIDRLGYIDTDCVVDVTEADSWKWYKVNKMLPLNAGGHIVSFGTEDTDLNIDAVLLAETSFDPNVKLGTEFATFSAESVMEAELGIINEVGEYVYPILSHANASGSKYVNSGTSWNQSTDPVDAGRTDGVKLRFNVKKAGKYYIWLRASSALSDRDSYFMFVNGEKNYGTYGNKLPADLKGAGTNFGWRTPEASETVELNLGVNEIVLMGRKPYVYFDAVYVTADPDFNPSTDL